ncbi:MAG: GxxExxY protein [Bacteroidales bacterium]|nr:GxxExxY protein [Bacteroidales bacterium]
MDKEFLYKEESYQIIGALFEVHKQLGCGFLEKIYQEALALEFSQRGIPFEREKKLDVLYKSHPLNLHYYVDFVCYDKIIVELKAVESLLDSHKSQIINYLKMGNYQLGILANFGETYMQPLRFVNIP